MRCKDCKQKGKNGYFLADEGFKVTEKMGRCKRSEEHEWPYRKHSMFSRSVNWITSKFRNENQGNLHCKNFNYNYNHSVEITSRDRTPSTSYNGKQGLHTTIKAHHQK